MSINNEPVGSVDSPGNMEKMSLEGDLYIGGYPGPAPYPDIMSTSNFSGCIDEVFLGLDIADLTNVNDAVNTREGCDVQVLNAYSDDQPFFDVTKRES